MAKYVICTVGTSIAINLGLDRDTVYTPRVWENDCDGLKDKMKIKLDQYIPMNSQNTTNQKALSAEINTLGCLDIQKNDRVALLSSDTGQGRICSDAVRRCLVSWYNLEARNISIIRVEGLQVNDEQRLKDVGLRNLVSQIINIMDSYQYEYEIIFNATGGYKGAIPFMAVIGMIFGKKIVYMFEPPSKNLLTLPPLPLSFNLTLFNRARPALDYMMKSNSCISKWEYTSRITDYIEDEESLFMSFVETEGSNVTISPLAFSLVAMEASRQRPQVLESVLHKLDELGVGNQEACKQLTQMISDSSSLLWRNPHYHRFSGTDLSVFKKPGSAYRIAGFLQDGIMYVTHAFNDHNEYERVLPGERKAEYLPGLKTYCDWETELVN